MTAITLSQKMIYKCLSLLTVLAVQQTAASTTSESELLLCMYNCKVLYLYGQQEMQCGVM